MTERTALLRPLAAGLALAAAASAWPLQAAAQTMGSGSGYSLLPWTQRGYVGINLGKPDFDAACGAGGFECDDPDASVQVYTGGLVNENLGIELGYMNSGRAERAGGRTRAQSLDLSAVLRAPMERFHVFAKGGVLYGEARVSTAAGSDQAAGTRRGWGARYGVGLGFDFTPSSGVVLEWSRYRVRFPGSGHEDLDLTSLGYVHRF